MAFGDLILVRSGGGASGPEVELNTGHRTKTGKVHEINAGDFPDQLTHAETLIKADARAWIVSKGTGVTRGDKILFTTALGIEHQYEIVVNANDELTIIEPQYGLGVEYPHDVTRAALLASMQNGDFKPGSRIDHLTLAEGVISKFLISGVGGVLNLNDGATGGGGTGVSVEVDTLGTVTGRDNVAAGDIEIPQGGRLIMTDDDGERIAMTIHSDDGLETNPA